MQRLWIGILALALLLVSGPALAEGMRIEPGKWEFTSTAKMPMIPTPKTTTQTQCVTEPEIKPEEFLQGLEGCVVSDVQSDAKSMRWKMTCTSDGVTMVGNAIYTSTGAQIQGSMTLVMNANGQPMTFEQSSQGKHLGACD